MTWRMRDVGPAAVLVECDPSQPARLAEAIRQRRLPGVVEIVPAATTVLVVCRDAGALDGVVDLVHGGTIDLVSHDAGGSTGEPIEIPTVFDGADLGDVARGCGLGVGELIERFVDRTYAVAFCGFAPGFAYLTGLDADLHLPRRATPRPVVPAGAVAIAAGYAAVYPTETPGGWHLLGRTPVAVWDPHRAPPALLGPGTEVRFVVHGDSC